MAQKLACFLMVFLLVSAQPLCVDAFWKELIGAAAGGALVIVGGPIALGVIGFTGAGITAGSAGAAMMSAAATTGYGAGVVATLQSAGAAGIAYSTAACGAAVGAGVVHQATEH